MKVFTDSNLLLFFRQVANRDSDLLKKLSNESFFVINKTHWCFTLPQLFKYLQVLNPAFQAQSYTQFRHDLFQSPINSMLKSFSAEITIAENKQKVDQTVYQLVWH